MRKFLRLNINDWLVVLSIAMLIASHALTNFVFARLSSSTIGVTIEALATLVEGSPVTRTLIALNQFGEIIRYIMVPAVVGGFYFVMRRRTFADPRDKDLAITAFAYVMFLVGLLNVTNDLSVLLGLYL